MEIYVNGRPAVLKKGLSFEFVAENRLFSGSDGYSLTIEFPLAECPENLAIFGHIEMPEFPISKLRYDCEIRHDGFTRRGCLAVTGVGGSTVKTQFLEGRSERNFTFSVREQYINTMELGYPSSTACNPTNTPPSEAWKTLDDGAECVALPWINDASGNLQNPPEVQYNGYWEWVSPAQWDVGLSWQIYLISLVKRIFTAYGDYSFDFSEWEASPLRFLLVCNVLPAAWGVRNFAAALPHWTVDELLEKIELLLGCDFEVDELAKKVSMHFTAATLAGLPDVELADVLDERTVDVSADGSSRSGYLGCKNVAYADRGDEQWKLQSCDWYVRRNIAKAEPHATLASLQSWFSAQRTAAFNVHNFFYAADVDTYFVVLATDRIRPLAQGERWRPRYVLQPVNQFGGRRYGEDAEEAEIDILPVRLGEAGYETYDSLAMFIPCPSSDGNGASDDDAGAADDDNAEHVIVQYPSAQAILGGEPGDRPEYFDRLLVGYWDGSFTQPGKWPHPIVDYVTMNPDGTSHINRDINLRLTGTGAISRFVSQINPTIKTTFKFLSAAIPNPRCVFVVNGHRYLCSKITATFTEEGPSRLMKGEFYEIE